MKTKINRFIVLTGVFFIMAQPLYAAQIETAKKVLDNGLTILVSPMPTSPTVSLYALVKVGSATEGKYLGSGISHFIEHMLFKGTAKRAVGVIATEIQAMGGTINASTGMDYTIYTITVPAGAALKALDVLSDMVMNSTMDPVEAKKEQIVIFREMNLHNDNPDRRVSQDLYKTVYLNHSYRHPTIGYEGLFGAITPEDLKAFYKQMYAPNNMVISIAGKVDAPAMMDKAVEAFNDFKRQPDVMRNLPKEAEQVTPRFYEDEYPTQTTRLMMAYPTVSLLNHDLFALDVLSMILGQGKTSRLYNRLFKQEQLVYTIGSWNHTPIDPGIFVVSAECDLGNVEKIQDDVKEEIDAIKKKGVSAQELDKAKRQVVSDFEMGHQTTEEVAYTKATDEAFTGDRDFSEKYTEGIQRVTDNDIRRVANQYLKQEALSTVILKPKVESVAQDKPAEAKIIGQIQKIELNNGMTVLLRKDPTFPIVNFQIALLGGTRQETESLNGLSQLFSNVWLRGTKGRTADAVDEQVEGLGMSWGSVAGRNSVSISLSSLKDNTDAALDLLFDVVRNPVFPQSEIDKEKALQTVAIEQRDDDIFQFSAYHLKELLFTLHPMRWDINGTKESVAKITRDDLVKYYQELVVGNNMVVAVFGDFDTEAMIKKLNQTFGLLPRGNFLVKKFNEPSITQKRFKEEHLPKEQAMVMLGFHAPDMFSPDRYATEVLTAILGSSFSGRLFNHIRDQNNQAYTLGGQYLPSLDTGFMYFFALTVPENAQTVQQKLIEEIALLAMEPVTSRELEEIKTYLKGSFKGELQTNAALAFTTSLDEIYGLGYENYANYDKNIDQVTIDDISRLAKKYLDMNKAAVLVTLPNDKPETTTSLTAPAQGNP